MYCVDTYTYVYMYLCIILIYKHIFARTFMIQCTESTRVLLCVFMYCIDTCTYIYMYLCSILIHNNIYVRTCMIQCVCDLFDTTVLGYRFWWPVTTGLYVSMYYMYLYTCTCMHDSMHVRSFGYSCVGIKVLVDS